MPTSVCEYYTPPLRLSKYLISTGRSFVAMFRCFEFRHRLRVLVYFSSVSIISPYYIYIFTFFPVFAFGIYFRHLSTSLFSRFLSICFHFAASSAPMILFNCLYVRLISSFRLRHGSFFLLHRLRGILSSVFLFRRRYIVFDSGLLFSVCLFSLSSSFYCIRPCFSCVSCYDFVI